MTFKLRLVRERDMRGSTQAAERARHSILQKPEKGLGMCCDCSQLPSTSANDLLVVGEVDLEDHEKIIVYSEMTCWPGIVRDIPVVLRCPLALMVIQLSDAVLPPSYC